MNVMPSLTQNGSKILKIRTKKTQTVGEVNGFGNTLRRLGLERKYNSEAFHLFPFPMLISLISLDNILRICTF